MPKQKAELAKRRKTPRASVYDIRTGQRAGNTKPASAADFQPSEAAAEIIAMRLRRKAIDALWEGLDSLESKYEKLSLPIADQTRARKKLDAQWVTVADLERNYQDDLKELA